MTSTTELLKEIEEWQIKHTRQIETISPLSDATFFKIKELKSELKGRLSILKEMKEFLEDLKRKEFTDNLDICCYPREFYEKLEEINNEIKLIEGKI